MKAFRIVALGALLLVAGAVTARAQAPGQQQQGRRREQLLNNMELTDAQKSRLDEIQKKYAPEMMSIRDAMQSGGDRGETMKRYATLRDRSSAEIRVILTPDQQAVFDKNLAEQKARMDQMMKQAP